MTMNVLTRSAARWSLFQGILPIARQQIWKDVAAGLTLAALGIPTAMGYTRISQTPVVTGLYTLVLPMIVFALIGSSRHLVVAADSATAAILAGALVAYAAPFSPEYVALCSLVALLAACMLIVARIFQLGFLADFLSRSALIGFLTGVGVQVAAGEFGPLLGISEKAHGTVQQLLIPLRHLNHIQPATVLVSACVLLVILVLARFAPRVPGALLAVVGATVASAVFALDRYGIKTINSISGGLPHIVIPRVGWHLWPSLLATAASCTIVIIAQSAATSRSYALRYGDNFDENRDLFGLAMANVAAACTGTFTVNGSPTQSEIVEMAGGRSQVAQLTTATVVLLVLLFLARPLSFMPEAVLSAVVFLIAIRLINVRGMRDLYRMRRDEFWIASLTVLTVVGVGVKQGILAAVVISLIDHLRVSYHPPTSLLKLSPAGEFVETSVSSHTMALPGLMIYRFEAPLYYANADFFMKEILSLIQNSDPAPRWFMIRFSRISDVDYSASKMLKELIRRLQGRLTLVFCDVDEARRSLLKRYGVLDHLGDDKAFDHLNAAVAGFRASATTSGDGIMVPALPTDSK